MMAVKWMLIAAMTFLSLPAHGHVGDRVIPIFEIPDEEIGHIDVHDGSIGDWVSVIGEPTLMGREFRSEEIGQSYDPADFDFRVWLAWTRTSRVYVALESVDDVFVEGESVIGLEIDGDHSGGIYIYDTRNMSTTLWQETQAYASNLYNPESPRPVVMGSPMVFESTWFTSPPFADAGGSFFGENPTISVTEMYVTPFERLVLYSREETVISVLLPGKVVGFRANLGDDDNRTSENFNAVTDAHFVFPFRDFTFENGPVQFADALLVEAGGSVEEESIVQADSWARIKASLR